jgi:hypothetical protein
MVVNLLAVSRFEHLVLWLPALVIGIGLVGAVLILLGRAFATTVRESRHPRLVIGGLVGLVMLVVLLSWLGVTLPREG